VVDRLKLSLGQVVPHLARTGRGVQRRLRRPWKWGMTSAADRFVAAGFRPFVAHLQRAAESTGLTPQPLHQTHSSAASSLDDASAAKRAAAERAG
jgi:hypothetical protein